MAAATAFVALTATPAAAGSGQAACPGQNLPAETRLYRPIGATLAKPIAMSGPGAVGDFVTPLAHSHGDCL
ncbi:hypothetical protein ACI79J_22705 [Geodermatophilus sp. SYSU D01062]